MMRPASVNFLAIPDPVPVVLNLEHGFAFDVIYTIRGLKHRCQNQLADAERQNLVGVDTGLLRDDIATLQRLEDELSTAMGVQNG